MPLLVLLTGKRVIYLALELDRSWTETLASSTRWFQKDDGRERNSGTLGARDKTRPVNSTLRSRQEL